MKFLPNLLDQVEPHFEKGGKLEILYPAYEAADTFLYTPKDVTKGASHIRDSIDLKRTMITVVLALIPCIFMAMWNTGYQANLAMKELGLETATNWRGSIIDMLEIGYDFKHFMAFLLGFAVSFPNTRGFSCCSGAF